MGGFPEYVLLRDQKILNDLLSDILQRDIAVRHKIRNTRQLNELAVFLITNVTKEFSFNNLRKMFNFGSTNSVSQFISFLEDSYLVFTLSKFDYSLRKQSVNPKKIYVIDNGLVVQNSKSYTEDLGKLLENMVFICLKSSQKKIFYYRDVNECDFVIRQGSKITEAYQVCYNLDDLNRKREIDGLMEVLKKFNLKVGTILTYNQQDEFSIENRKINIVPLWKWMMEKR
jgi:predicted AAA+ superfamily ATPase